MKRALPLAVLCSCFHPVGAVDDVPDSGGDSVADAGGPFPVGVFTRCALGGSASFLIPTGFEAGATLTVSQTGSARGSTRTAMFIDSSGQSYVWSFAPTSSVSAVLASSPQLTAGFGSAVCVHGIGVSNETFFPLQLDATSGSLQYESGTVFLALDGELKSHTDCGDVSERASEWIVCTGGPVLSVSAPAPPPGPGIDWAIERLACKSQVGTHGRLTVDGKDLDGYSTNGGDGALTLTRAGNDVTAQYTGDPELSGTIHLTVNAGGGATTGTAQALTARCDDLTPASGELSVSAASLMRSGATFLSFVGTMSASSGCGGAEKIATLICTP
nr:hypothetical protein Hi04_10k_c3807_00009 [uncultured bacterium]